MLESQFTGVASLDVELLGEYAGFDDTQPTSTSGGKGIVVGELKRKYGYNNLVVIGDGMTDLEASPPAEAFIGKWRRRNDEGERSVKRNIIFSGYGGNVVREAVRSKAKWYITDFNELISAHREP